MPLQLHWLTRVIFVLCLAMICSQSMSRLGKRFTCVVRIGVRLWSGAQCTPHGDLHIVDEEAEQADGEDPQETVSAAMLNCRGLSKRGNIFFHKLWLQGSETAIVTKWGTTIQFRCRRMRSEVWVSGNSLSP